MKAKKDEAIAEVRAAANVGALALAIIHIACQSTFGKNSTTTTARF
jgi:hypothetical protein